MATKLKEVGTDIVAVVEASPVIVLTDEAKFNQFYEAMREECDRHEPDLSTEKGRKAIASLAYKVARTKTAIDDAGKKLNEEARARINAIDEARRKIRQQLDDLRDDVRRPLTDWEDAEDARAETVASELATIQGMQRVDIDDTRGHGSRSRRASGRYRYRRGRQGDDAANAARCSCSPGSRGR